MEVGAHVWLRSNASQWGWVPAIITGKESIPKSAKHPVPMIQLTLRNDQEDISYSPRKAPRPQSYSYFSSRSSSFSSNNNNNASSPRPSNFDVTIEIDPEQLKSADHNDIKLRNKLSDYKSAGADKEAGVVASPVTITQSNVVGGVNDLIGLTHLHEPAILHALRLRYGEDIIYTSTGPILIAVNPFKAMPGLYSDDVMEEYRQKGESISIQSQNKNNSNNNSSSNGSKNNKEAKLPPHVYQTADDSYRAMMFALEMSHMSSRSLLDVDRIPTADQSILVSGESGAGKTVTTKIVLNYFAMLSKRNSESYPRNSSSDSNSNSNDSNDRSIEQQVLESNPILESFGNARTIRNDNSSRFGKYIDVRFTIRGKLSGASIETYLLEKVRLIHPGKNERNYHIFYQFLEAASDSERQQYLLHHLNERDFKILSQTDTYDRRDGVSDRENHEIMMHAMETIGFDQDTRQSLMRLVTAVLFAGNMTFSRGKEAHHESCTLDKNNESIATATLLGVSFDDLAASLTSRKMSAGFEKLTKMLSLEQAAKGQEALMKAIYGALFDFIVRRINVSILEENTGNENNNRDYNRSRREMGYRDEHERGVASIGVLDIFGFESFATNGFEQICINYTNEALQQQFNKFVFKVEQQEYEREGILWKFIAFPDNQDVLDLIELRHTGILAILDEQCLVPQPSDQKLTRYLYQKCDKHNRFVATPAQKVAFLFSIKHYAGEVEYCTEHWIEKNKDELPAGSAELLLSSNLSFLSTDLKPFFRMESGKKTNTGPFGGFRRSSTLITKSVGAQFAEQLRKLRSRIDLTIPHYIRCLKPNDNLVPNRFEPKNVVEQLRCGGVLEAVRVSRAGYPTRYPHEVFLARYSVLLNENGNVDHYDYDDNSSVISSWTDFGARETYLKKLVSKISFDVWKEEHERMLKIIEAEKLREESTKTQKFEKVNVPVHHRTSRTYTKNTRSPPSSPSSKTTINKTKPKNNKSNSQRSLLTDGMISTFDRPETNEEFLSLDFSSRCAVAGLQLGKTKVFLRREAFERIEAMRSRMFFDSASKIQALCRRFLARRYFLQRKRAIVYIQSIIRMFLAIQKRKSVELVQKVILIQSLWRRAYIRHTVWSCYLEIKYAATTIQRAFRSSNIRNIYHAHRSATQLQAWFRGNRARKESSHLIYHVVKIQAFLRGAHARMKVLDASDEHNKEKFMRAKLTRVSGNKSSKSAAMALTPRKKQVKNIPFSVNPNIPVKKTSLYELIEEEDWTSVEATLDQHPELAEEVEPSSGELPLHIMARHRSAWTLLIDMVLVLHPKALVHRDRMGALPIHHAAAHDNLAALEIIHSAYKEGINEADYQGRLPIHVAAEFDAVEAVKYLLAKAPEGAYTMIQSRKAVSGGGLPLHAACRNYASIGVITAFLAENFASAKKPDDNGDLPLHLLLRCGASVDQVVVKTLLTCFSAAVSRTDMNGDLPLSTALKHRCKASVVNTILIQYPAAASTLNRDGHTPLFLAFEHAAEDRTILGLLNHAPELATQMDEKTGLLPIQMATQNEHSPFIVHNLLRRDMPIDLKEKVRAQLLPHHYSWNHIVNDTNDMYHMVVNKLLQQCTQPQVLALAHVEGKDGQIALASATPVCKHELRVMLRLFNTLEVVNQRPAYTNPASDTQIFYALRYNPPNNQHNNFTILHEDNKQDGYSNMIEEFDDTSMYSGASMSTSHSSLSARSQASVSDKLRMIRKEKGQQVIAKLTSRADVVERELKIRKDYHLSRHYVPAIISVHHTVQHAAYSEAMAEPGYCITMEGADTTAENLILDLRKSGKKFPTKALKRIGISLLHMHEHGVIHCDFGTHNIGKFGSRWKLLGVGASVPIGQKTDPNRGFYHPPESIFVETKHRALHKKSVSATVYPINATTTYDIWAYGVVMYEAIVGSPLGPYACRGKREMSQSEIAKIGKWDDHYLRKALKLVEIDDVAKDLLKGLLHGDAKKRISSMREVLEHPFFARESVEHAEQRAERERHKHSSLERGTRRSHHHHREPKTDYGPERKLHHRHGNHPRSDQMSMSHSQEYSQTSRHTSDMNMMRSPVSSPSSPHDYRSSSGYSHHSSSQSPSSPPLPPPMNMTPSSGSPTRKSRFKFSSSSPKSRSSISDDNGSLPNGIRNGHDDVNGHHFHEYGKVKPSDESVTSKSSRLSLKSLRKKLTRHHK